MSRGRRRGTLGELELQLLLALRSLTRASSARDLFDWLAQSGEADPSIVAIHLTLDRLVRKGLVARCARRGEGRAVKHFALRPAGRSALRAEKKRWDRLWARAFGEQL